MVGKKVKVVYSDIGKESFARGVLEKEDSKFLYIRELKDMDIIEEAKDGLKVTDHGRIVVL